MCAGAEVQLQVEHRPDAAARRPTARRVSNSWPLSVPAEAAAARTEEVLE